MLSCLCYLFNLQFFKQQVEWKILTKQNNSPLFVIWRNVIKIKNSNTKKQNSINSVILFLTTIKNYLWGCKKISYLNAHKKIYKTYYKKKKTFKHLKFSNIYRKLIKKLK